MPLFPWFSACSSHTRETNQGWRRSQKKGRKRSIVIKEDTDQSTLQTKTGKGIRRQTRHEEGGKESMWWSRKNKREWRWRRQWKEETSLLSLFADDASFISHLIRVSSVWFQVIIFCSFPSLFPSFSLFLSSLNLLLCCYSLSSHSWHTLSIAISCSSLNSSLPLMK